MPSAQILETIVTPTGSSSTIQLYISDAPRDAEDAGIRLTLTVSIPAYRVPLLAHLQRDALDKAAETLRSVYRGLGIELEKNGRPLDAT
jgi:hypothetical protein